MTAVRRAYADLSVGQVHYASCGDPGQALVLLLHQSPRSWREYAQVLPLLGRHWHAVAMDTAGFGDSDDGGGSVHSIADYARVALELVDALGAPQVHVVGHHTGGVIGLEMAAADTAGRVASLVLSGTGFIDDASRRARVHRPAVDQVERKPDGSHLMDLWRGRQAFYPPDRPELLEQFVRDALAVRDPEAGHQAVAQYPMETRIGLVRQPVLIVRAEADPFTAPAATDLARCLPQAELVSVPGGMVPLPDQMPDVFAGVVADFLRRQSRPT
jgi:pimeloyl-ACP methyl ester carboxylesterase